MKEATDFLKDTGIMELTPKKEKYIHYVLLEKAIMLSKLPSLSKYIADIPFFKRDKRADGIYSFNIFNDEGTIKLKDVKYIAYVVPAHIFTFQSFENVNKYYKTHFGINKAIKRVALQEKHRSLFSISKEDKNNYVIAISKIETVTQSILAFDTDLIADSYRPETIVNKLCVYANNNAKGVILLNKNKKYIAYAIHGLLD